MAAPTLDSCYRFQEGFRLRRPFVFMGSPEETRRAGFLHHLAAKFLQRPKSHGEDRRQKQTVQHRARRQARGPTQLIFVQRATRTNLPEHQTDMGTKGLRHTIGKYTDDVLDQLEIC